MDGRSGRNWSNGLRSWAGDPDPFHREKVFFNPDISRLNESDGGNYREQMDGKELEGKKERYKLILLKSLLHFLGAEVVGENSRGSCTRVRTICEEKLDVQFGIYRESGDSTSGNRRIGCLEGRAAPFKARSCTRVGS